jgi:hypothetical protein
MCHAIASKDRQARHLSGHMHVLAANGFTLLCFAADLAVLYSMGGCRTAVAVAADDMLMVSGFSKGNVYPMFSNTGLS